MAREKVNEKSVKATEKNESYNLTCKNTTDN